MNPHGKSLGDGCPQVSCNSCRLSVGERSISTKAMSQRHSSCPNDWFELGRRSGIFMWLVLLTCRTCVCRNLVRVPSSLWLFRFHQTQSCCDSLSSLEVE